MSNHNYRVFHPMGYLSLLSITQHKFSLPLYSIVQLCWTSSHLTKPAQSITKRSVDYSHALTLIQCDVLVYMQCNAPFHILSCHMYNECYMDNIIHTTHRVSWTITSPAYDFHTTFHSCQYILHAYININIQHVILCSSNGTHRIKPYHGHLPI